MLRLFYLCLFLSFFVFGCSDDSTIDQIDQSVDNALVVDIGFDIQPDLNADFSDDLIQDDLGLNDQSISDSSAQSSFEEITSWISANKLRLFLFTPSTPAKDPALVVALHGCGQDALEYTKAGWNEFAQARGFYVLYPQIDDNLGCFHWFDENHALRDHGEAKEIAEMTQWAIQSFGIDKNKVFLTGLSAGGAMTAAVLASYPDVFSAGAVHAGVPYRCSTSLFDALYCMYPGKNLTPDLWLSKLKAGYANYSGDYPRLSIWHGKADYTVNDLNGIELAEQWSAAFSLAYNDSTETTIDPGITQRVWPNKKVELWMIEDMGHAVAVSSTCGKEGKYFSLQNICATEQNVAFFGL